MARHTFISDPANSLRWLRAFRGLIAEHADELVRLMGEEIHKPEFEALASDVLPLISACTWHLKRSKKLLRDRRTPGKPLWLPGVRHRTCRAPLGRVAIIATWNYPVQLLGVQLIQAVMADNRVIVKPSERSPKTQLLLLELAREAGLSAEVLVWTDATREAGERLVEHEPFDHLLFTGSTAVGKTIAAALAPRLITSTLELSGNDTAVVLPSANPKLAARCIWYALTLNHGQTCMAPRRVLVAPEVREPFMAKLYKLASNTDGRRLIDAEAAERCRQVAREAIAAGGRLANGNPGSDPLQPIVIDDCPTDTDLYKGKHFGPVLPVAVLEEDSAIPASQLTMSVFGKPAEALEFARRFRAGTFTINDCIIPTGHPGAPLSASGSAGWGVSRGEAGLLAMTRPVSVSTTRAWPRLPLDPPGVPVSKITPWLRRLYAAKKKATEDGTE